MKSDYPAIAVDWLDAYREKDLEGILAFFADDAMLECGCGGAKTINGKTGLRAYWKDRLAKLPASRLEAVVPSAKGATVEYRTPDGVVRIAMHFNDGGFIARAKCGPVELPATQAPLAGKASQSTGSTARHADIVRHRQLARQCLALALEVKDPSAAERLRKLAADHAREIERLSRRSPTGLSRL